MLKRKPTLFLVAGYFAESAFSRRRGFARLAPLWRICFPKRSSGDSVNRLCFVNINKNMFILSECQKAARDEGHLLSFPIPSVENQLTKNAPKLSLGARREKSFPWDAAGAAVSRHEKRSIIYPAKINATPSFSAPRPDTPHFPYAACIICPFPLS